MKFLIKSILIILVFFSSEMLFPQQESDTDKSENMFTIRGFVRESESYNPIQNVSIQIKRRCLYDNK